MNFKMILKARIIFLARVAMLCGLFLCLACVNLHKAKSIFIESSDYDVYLKTLEKGNEAFQKGNFNKAREIYEILYKNSGDETITRKALYAFACTHFILSNNYNDFNKTFVLWEKWSNLKPSVMENEDPRMLGPLLQNKVTKWINDAGTSETLKLEVNKLTLLLQSKEQEIQTFKHQIKTLEEIDRKIYEKQQGISSN